MKTVEELEKRIEQCKELKKDLNEALDEIIKNAEQKSEELKQQEKTEWVPEKDDKYWFIDTDIMLVKISSWENDNYDNTRLKHKVIFKTEKEAKEWLDYLLAKEKAINTFTKEEWKNNAIDKCYIKYNHIGEGLEIDVNWVCQPLQQPHFYTEEDAEAFIEKYEKCIKRDMGICEN